MLPEREIFARKTMAAVEYVDKWKKGREDNESMKDSMFGDPCLFESYEVLARGKYFYYKIYKIT